MNEQMQIEMAKVNFRYHMAFTALTDAIAKSHPEIIKEYEKSMVALKPKIDEYFKRLDDDYESRQGA